MSSISAAVMWNNGKVYFFRADQYYRYDIAADRVDDGYPRPIAGNWPGLWDRDIDTAINWGNGKTYFFKGDQYARYDMAADHVESGYPRPVAGNWPGLAPASPAVETDADGNRLLTAGNWAGSSQVRVTGGQTMHFEIQNLNVLGTTISIKADRTNETKSQLILPHSKGNITFQQFGRQPMGWVFDVSTQSDAFVVGWKLFSSWVQGDPHD